MTMTTIRPAQSVYEAIVSKPAPRALIGLYRTDEQAIQDVLSLWLEDSGELSIQVWRHRPSVCAWQLCATLTRYPTDDARVCRLHRAGKTDVFMVEEPAHV